MDKGFLRSDVLPFVKLMSESSSQSLNESYLHDTNPLQSGYIQQRDSRSPGQTSRLVSSTGDP